MSGYSHRGHDIAKRTKELAVRIIRMYVELKCTRVMDVIGKQVLRCGTSVGAQYREAMRARSRAEFCSKVDACLQELDETAYWLEILVESGQVKQERLESLQSEVNELTSILVASARTAKRNK